MNKVNTELKHWLKLNCSGKPEQHSLKRKLAPKRVFLGEKYPGIYLTERQAQCVYHLLQLKKRREIAHQLNLSIRTIEAYVTEVKLKLKCHRQKELINQIEKTDFLKNYCGNAKTKRRTQPTAPQSVQLNTYQPHSLHY